MKTLVIHPYDLSTGFLARIYAPIRNKTVISHGIEKDELYDLLFHHDRIMMLGHGSPEGLCCVGQFRNTCGYIIDETMVDLLKRKNNNVFIWCHADEFVTKHHLKGFYTGMFISETREAEYCGLSGIDHQTVRISNFSFSRSMSRYIEQDKATIRENVVGEYALLAATNRVAAYNVRRLYVQ